MEWQNRRRVQYTDGPVGNGNIISSEAVAQVQVDLTVDLNVDVSLLGSDDDTGSEDTGSEDTGSEDVGSQEVRDEGYKTPRCGPEHDRRVLLADIRRYLCIGTVADISKIERVAPTLKRVTPHIEGTESEDIIEWKDPIPDWEPQEDGQPLWMQCLRDDVAAILLVPEWPAQSLTWDEYDHYCVRKSMVEEIHPETLLNEDRECSICHEPFDDGKKGAWEEKHIAIKVACRGQHLMGSICLYRWFGTLDTEFIRSCPMCRDKLVDPPVEQPYQTLEDVLDTVENNGTLLLWTLQYYSDISHWFFFGFEQLQEELKFVYQILISRIDLHMPVELLAECRERARILMRMLIEHMSDCPLKQVCLRNAFSEYKSPKTICDWTLTTRMAANTNLVQDLRHTVLCYIKTIDVPDKDPWDLFSAEQIKTGSMDSYGKEFWLRVINAAQHTTSLLQAEKYFGHQGDSGYTLRHGLHEREKLQKLGLFRFLFRHDDSFDQDTMDLLLKKISLDDLGSSLRQTVRPTLEDFYQAVNPPREETKCGTANIRVEEASANGSASTLIKNKPMGTELIELSPIEQSNSVSFAQFLDSCFEGRDDF